MTKLPTYTAIEIEALAKTLNDAEGLRALAELINEEIELYNEDEMMIVGRATIIIFVRSLIIGPIKFLL